MNWENGDCRQRATGLRDCPVHWLAVRMRRRPRIAVSLDRLTYASAEHSCNVADADRAWFDDAGVDTTRCRTLAFTRVTNFVASVPNRAENLRQPSCGTSVTSITADPSASWLPRRKIVVAQFQVDEDLVSCQGQRSFCCATRAMAREFIRLSCMPG